MRRIIGLALAGVVLLVLVVAQLILPRIAAQRLRDQLSPSGTVLEVKVSAFPAVKLLWHHADRVVVHLGRYTLAASRLRQTLAETASVGTLDATASEFASGLLTLRNAVLRKRGDDLTASATIAEADLRSAIPFLDNVQPVASSGRGLTLRGTASLLGLSATVNATVAAVGGALVVAPDVPFGGIATITLFSDPHVHVESVAAVAVAGGFRISAQAKLT